jgi:type IV pilus biogenesis protein CpaD/CtpE
MKMIKLVSIPLLLSLGACQNYWTASPDFGSSVNGAIAAQTVNPNAASQAPSDVKGMDGPSAKSSIDSYQNTFIRRSPAMGGNPSSTGYFTGGQSGAGSSNGSGGSMTGIPAQ